MSNNNEQVAKEQEKAELHKMLWRAADDLVHSGGVDAWDFKQYVLGTMFYRYLSENFADFFNDREHAAGNSEFDYAALSDDTITDDIRSYSIKTKGFFLYPSELFCNLRKRASRDENLNVTIETIFRNIEESASGTPSEGAFKGLFDDFKVNDSKLGSTTILRNKMFVKLLDTVGDMKVGRYQDHNIDAFGDAYEYLMGMYASNAGKKGGEYFTPQEVSELLTHIAVDGKTEVRKVYDPACGSGSLLLKTAKILGKDKVINGFYGQDISDTLCNLSRINMFLHDIEPGNFSIIREDTLTKPQHEEEAPFDVIVSNPPYSTSWEGKDNPLLINDPRYSPAGVLAPKTNSDFAFILHSLSWLSTDGVAAIVCFPGIMYRGNAEQKIRKYLIDNNFVDCIIQLPPNLFFGTSIATCIMVLKKSKSSDEVLFVDASNEFVKVGNKNKLSDANISRIMEIYNTRASIKDVSALGSISEIGELQGYNLSVSTYVEHDDSKKEEINIKDINLKIKEIVLKEQELRDAIDTFIAEREDWHE